MGQPQLPFDIWERIALMLDDEIGPNLRKDFKPLKALSLACKSMVPLCRKYLFSTFDLASNYEFRCKRIISDNPALIAYIRVFNYLIFEDDDDNRRIVDLLLDRSSVLYSITLGSLYEGWDTFPSKLQDSLERLIRLPTVTHVSLQEMERVPSHILGSCTRLTHLVLNSVNLVPKNSMLNDAHHSIRPRPLCLKVLMGLSPDYNPIRVLFQEQGPDSDQTTIDLSGLKELMVGPVYSKADARIICNLLRVNTALEHLELTISEPPNALLFAGCGAALTIHAFSTLKRFSLHNTVNGDDADPLCGLIPELAVIAGRNIREEISVSIRVGSQDFIQRSGEHWARMDSLLAELGSFRRLRLVSVVVSCGYKPSETTEVIDADSISKQFPLLSKNDGVEFTFSTIYTN